MQLSDDFDFLLDEPEPERVARALLDLVLRRRSVPNATVLLNDPSRGGLVLAADAFHGDLLLDPRRLPRLLLPRTGEPTPRDLERRRRPRAEGIFFRVLRTGSAHVSDDLDADPDHTPIFHHSRSCLAIPTGPPSEVTAVVLLESSREREFARDEIAAFKDLSGAAHTYLLKARMYMESKSTSKPILMIGLDRETVDAAFRTAAYDVPVLLQGETGTGKDLLARAIHRRSPRRAFPFEAVNCSTLCGPLALSFLFGHVKGAFTDAGSDRPGILEAADGGTLFLDEIEKMPLESQVLLLRVLESQEFSPLGAPGRKKRVNIRVIAAATGDPGDGLRNGSFLPDLFYRLSAVCLRLKPLRERRRFIPRLVRRTMQALERDHPAEPKTITEAALERLQAHSYPGNVRELQNVITQAFITDTDGRIDVDDLPGFRNGCGRHSDRAVGVTEALRACGGNVRQAAARLGVSRARFYELMKESGIDPDGFRPVC